MGGEGVVAGLLGFALSSSKTDLFAPPLQLWPNQQSWSVLPRAYETTVKVHVTAHTCGGT